MVLGVPILNHNINQLIIGYSLRFNFTRRYSLVRLDSKPALRMNELTFKGTGSAIFILTSHSSGSKFFP